MMTQMNISNIVSQSYQSQYQGSILNMDQKKRFDEKILEMKAEQGKNVKMFSDLEYQLKIERLKEVRMAGHKWIPQDYALVTKFDILEVEKDGQIHQRLVNVDKKDGSRKWYAT